MRGFVSLLGIAGGALIFSGRQIPFTVANYDAFPGGAKLIGLILVLFGLWLALLADD